MRILEERFDAGGCWKFICACCHNALCLYLPLSSFLPWNNLFSISTVCHLVFPFQLSLSWWFFSFCFMLWMRCLCGFLLDVYLWMLVSETTDHSDRRLEFLCFCLCNWSSAFFLCFLCYWMWYYYMIQYLLCGFLLGG